MTIRALIFDYGNVLDISEDESSWHANREQRAAQLGLTGDQLWNVLYNSEPWQQVKRGQISQADYYNLMLKPLGLADPEAQVAFMTSVFAGRDKVHREMDTLLRTLRPYYRLAMLSNTDIIEMADWLVKDRGLAGIFDVVVSSAQVGMAKPEPEIYRYTLEQLEAAPDEVLFIDDMVRNTAAAQTLGIDSIIFQSPAQLRHELHARGIRLEGSDQR